MRLFLAMKRTSLSLLCLLACEKTVAAPATPTDAAAPTATDAATTPAPVDTNCEPDVLGDGRPDRVAFEEDGRWGFRDADGKVVIAAQYVMVSPYTAEGVAGVISEGGAAFIDLSGRKVATALMFDNGPDYFVQGLARIVEGGKTGFVDRAGKIAIAPQFDAAGSFCEGLAPVCMGCEEVPRGEHRELVGGQWGFVDRSGAVVIPIAYDSATGFTEGGATVGKGGRTSRIDRRGTELPDSP
jgi:hypothetical protein